MLRPHDTFFKKLMSNPENVKDFLANFLPEDLRNIIDFTSIKIIDTEKLDRKYKKYYLDLSVECRLRKSKSQIYIVFEHKSYPDKLTLIQVLNYCSVIWENNLRNNEKLIPIIPLIFYHGKRKFDLPTKFIEYFEIEEEIKRYLLNFEVILFDLNKVEEEELMKVSRNVYLLSGLLMMKHIFSGIDEIKEVFRKVIQIDKESFLMVLEYLVMSKDIEEEELEEIIKEVGGEDMPSLAERWIQQGLVQDAKEMVVEAYKVKFGKIDRRFKSCIERLNDRNKLKRILQEIIKAKDMKEVEEIFERLS